MVVRLYSGLKKGVNPAPTSIVFLLSQLADHCPGVAAGGSREPSPEGIEGTCCSVSNSVSLKTIATSTNKSATKRIPDLSMRLLMSRYVKGEYVQFEASKE